MVWMVSRVLIGNNSFPSPPISFISRIEACMDSSPFAPYFFKKIKRGVGEGSCRQAKHGQAPCFACNISLLKIIFYFFYMIVSIITILFRNSRRGNTYFTSRNNHLYLILLWSFEYTVFASKIALIWNLQYKIYCTRITCSINLNSPSLSVWLSTSTIIIYTSFISNNLLKHIFLKLSFLIFMSVYNLRLLI